MPKSRRVNANFDDDGDGNDGEVVFVEAFEVDIGDVTMATPGAKYGGHGCARSGINLRSAKDLQKICKRSAKAAWRPTTAMTHMTHGSLFINCHLLSSCNILDVLPPK